MTPAPDTGRTAEEMRADIIAALNAAFRGFSFPGGRWSEGYGAEMAAEALLAGPLAPVLAEIAQLRSRLLQAEKGGEAMRTRTAAALNEACRMETIRLKIGELSPQEQQLASIVAGLVRGAIRAALNPNQEAGDHEPR